MGLLRKSHIDLFSGIGGFALASKWAGFETIQFVENDNYCCKVLKKNFPEIPIHDDIRTFKATDFRGCGLITGGVPCQPVSQAGKRRGSEDDRWLWPQMYRVILESRPTYVLIENVAGLITLGLDDVLVDLEKADYSFQTFNIPAVAVDARHRRQRIWILAYSFNNEQDLSSRPKSSQQPDDRQKWREMGSKSYRRSDKGGEDVAHSNSSGFSKQCTTESIREEQFTTECSSRWSTEPDVGRVAHGVRRRVDRLRGLGNSVVPRLAYEIIRCLK